MITLKNDDIEIGIYPSMCIEARSSRGKGQRTIDWTEVKQSNILRHLTENLISKLIYELNGFYGAIKGYEPIEEEIRQNRNIDQPDIEPDINLKLSSKLFLNSKEVSELYGIAPSTLANWRHQMIGPKYHKVGGAVRYKVEDLEEFMDGRKVRTE